MFFLTSLPELPSHAEEDGAELVSMELLDPLSYIKGNQKGTLQMAAPQFIELSRMAKFWDHKQLLEYAHGRQDFGLERWLPWTVVTEGLGKIYFFEIIYFVFYQMLS